MIAGSETLTCLHSTRASVVAGDGEEERDVLGGWQLIPEFEGATAFEYNPATGERRPAESAIRVHGGETETDIFPRGEGAVSRVPSPTELRPASALRLAAGAVPEPESSERAGCFNGGGGAALWLPSPTELRPASALRLAAGVVPEPESSERAACFNGGGGAALLLPSPSVSVFLDVGASRAGRGRKRRAPVPSPSELLAASARRVAVGVVPDSDSSECAVRLNAVARNDEEVIVVRSDAEAGATRAMSAVSSAEVARMRARLPSDPRISPHMTDVVWCTASIVGSSNLCSCCR